MNYTIALAGNPNVGKSTVFNALTGLHQHTGNWPGKTVGSAVGTFHHRSDQYKLVDLPGTYSLTTHSTEEEIAASYLCFEHPDAVIVVCDATCLERNLILVLQILSITTRVVVCVNLMDEAQKKGITVDCAALESLLGVPVVGTTACSKKGLHTLKERLTEVITASPVGFTVPLTAALSSLVELIEVPNAPLPARFVATQRLIPDSILCNAPSQFFETAFVPLSDDHPLLNTFAADRQGEESATDQVIRQLTACYILTAEDLSLQVLCGTQGCHSFDQRIDRVVMGRWTAIPLMLLVLCMVLWITIAGANVPSGLLATGFEVLKEWLVQGLNSIGIPMVLQSVLLDGVYDVLSSVIAVMLPPMAIFFPLFTLLEDFGFFPRVAVCLDHSFQKAKSCGKQALTMCMGLGCNAVGVIGCRIIDSPRERLVAIITNNFVPCNGRFPTLLAMIAIFFTGTAVTTGTSLLSALMMTTLLVLSVAVTFAVSRLLSTFYLKGEASSFALELPSYRRPQFGKVLVRSIFDRTLRVLWRAAVVAAPAGLVIWALSNLMVDGVSLLSHLSTTLDPIGQFLGLDGTILLAFILGFPANEIVLPIALMTYLSTNTLTETASLAEMGTILTENGWTTLTAVNVMIFCLFHMPCSTTCLTIYKETKSVKHTVVAALLPLGIGVLFCAATNFLLSPFF